MAGWLRPYDDEDDSHLRACSDQIKKKTLPGFDAVDAVKNDRVYIITNDYAITPNYPSALLLLAKWFYPDIFDDLNPSEAHLEYLDLMGISKEVANKNTYYYPAVA
ncbi:hypothetical protein [Candidatus Methanocrinis natronophilus]|uniref:Fe/B12 periplasmic-binding domain-containing protein n=1 Tax=Candidatus Methanocrinis natronophilus TaxID=3033396 RepID=A0ABT5X5E9_9EURY|nr:hypothetical protein [Candidatus Methanocrinis natronophilus]MDF0589920.1 hypothetical protein [Candidatus Methanocrinis natronophilus]